MSGLPATSARNRERVCTGDWACDGERHCVCWWDSPTWDTRCCQCGDTEADEAVPGVDYERSSCPVCGDPDCTFPPECRDALGTWPEPGYGEE